MRHTRRSVSRRLVPVAVCLFSALPIAASAGVVEFENFTGQQSTSFPATSQLAAYAEIDVNSFNNGTCAFGTLSKTSVKTCLTDAKIISNVDMTVTFTPSRLKRTQANVDYFVDTQYIHAQEGNTFGISDPDIANGEASTTQNASLNGVLYSITGEADPYAPAVNPAGSYTATINIAVTPIP
jgi:hypothetical protein